MPSIRCVISRAPATSPLRAIHFLEEIFDADGIAPGVDYARAELAEKTVHHFDWMTGPEARILGLLPCPVELAHHSEGCERCLQAVRGGLQIAECHLEAPLGLLMATRVNLGTVTVVLESPGAVGILRSDADVVVALIAHREEVRR